VTSYTTINDKNNKYPVSKAINVVILCCLGMVNISKIFRVHRHWNSEMLGKVFRTLQVLSLEILGPKVVENFLLYRVVQALRLQSHQPHQQSGPEHNSKKCLIKNSFAAVLFMKINL